MTFRGLNSVLVVTILGFVLTACDGSSKGVPLELARVTGGEDSGLTQEKILGGQEGVETAQPSLRDLKVEVEIRPGTQNVDSSSAGGDTNTETSSVSGSAASSAEGENTQDSTQGSKDTSEQSAQSKAQRTVEISDVEHWQSLTMPGQLRELISRARLECALQSEWSHFCLSSALVLSMGRTTEGEVQTTECTAQYVGDNTVMTAAHCISQEVLDGAASCTDSVAFGFYQEDAGELLPASCVSVKEYFREYTERAGERVPDLKKPDVVFLEVQFDEGQGEVVEQNALTLSRDGFRSEDDFYFVSMTPSSATGLGGKLELKQCQSIENTVLLDQHRDSRSTAVVLMGESCVAPPGNSGAAVISYTTGTVVGAVHAYMDQAAEKYQELGYRISSEGLLNPVVATNFACLPSAVVETVHEMGGCNNLEQLTEQKRRSHWQSIELEYDNALAVSRQQSENEFALKAVEISDLVKVHSEVQVDSSFSSPLRGLEETLRPSFECYTSEATERDFDFGWVQRKTYQILDKNLRIKTEQSVSEIAKSYGLRSASGGLARLTEVDTGRRFDLPHCN